MTDDIDQPEEVARNSQRILLVDTGFSSAMLAALISRCTDMTISAEIPLEQENSWDNILPSIEVVQQMPAVQASMRRTGGRDYESPFRRQRGRSRR